MIKSCLNLYKYCWNLIKIPYSPFQILCEKTEVLLLFPQLVCVVHKFHCDSNQVIWTLFGVFSVWGNSAYWGKKLLLYFREQTFLPFSQKLNKVNQEMNLLIFQQPIWVEISECSCGAWPEFKVMSPCLSPPVSR